MSGSEGQAIVSKGAYDWSKYEGLSIYHRKKKVIEIESVFRITPLKISYLMLQQSEYIYIYMSVPLPPLAYQCIYIYILNIPIQLT